MKIKNLQAKSWPDHYRDRVRNRDYSDAFNTKYVRFVDEIIIQVKRLATERNNALVLKEEGCGIGSVSRSISKREPLLLRTLGLSSEESRIEIDKVVLSDSDSEMLSLCMDNTRSLSLGRYLADKPFFYSKESILNPKFFEPNTIVVTHGVLEHFSQEEVRTVISTYNDENVIFQAHYVPTDGYKEPSFGDERLLPVSEWIELLAPDYYIVDNNGLDLYMFSIKK